MKKVRILIASLAVVTVVGSALAFKAAKTNISVYQRNGSTCQLLQAFEVATIGAANDFQTSFTSATITETSDISKCATTLFLKDE
jgi:hypothetical protein